MAAKLIDNCWLVPTKVNQGCYDVLQLLLSSFTLRVVQLTVAATHSLKLRYVIRILNILRQMNIDIKLLDIVIVLPPETVANFKLGNVESDKNIAITNLGWNTSQVRTLGFRRTGIVYDM